ncbi:hypothetical protein RDI58_019634 [Solanum bulbocastanum]|uniref:Integrase catalytic domain-containing protein n=1 Tax=Solanum bulbocastanum TaxID=147425 RepID=A0AAN8TC06_SOLBU
MIQDRKTKQVLARGKYENGLYVLHNEHQALAAITNSSLKASYELWHSRLGHVAFDTVLLLRKLGCLSVTSILPKPVIFSSCQLSKGYRLTFDLNTTRSLHPLDLIHCDLWGPTPITSTANYRYYVAFVDDYSRFTWFYPLQTKSGFASVLSVFMKFVQTQFSQKIKVFQSDGGTEFVNHTVYRLFEDNGTLHRLSCPYTPQQNSRVAMLFNANVPTSYWVDVFSSAVYIINRLPTKVLNNKSPFELLFFERPNYHNFKVYGCQVFPYLRDYADHKLSSRSLPCIFIGYSSQYKGYRCLDPATSRIYVTRHARFDEHSLPFSRTTSSKDLNSLQLATFLESLSMPQESSTVTDPSPSSASLHLPSSCPPCCDAYHSDISTPYQPLHTNPSTVSPLNEQPVHVPPLPGLVDVPSQQSVASSQQSSSDVLSNSLAQNQCPLHQFTPW